MTIDLGQQFSFLFGHVLGISAVLPLLQEGSAMHSWCMRAPGWTVADLKQLGFG